MGCICSKGIRANEYVQNSLVNELDSPKTSKRLSLSLRKDNGEAKEADCDGNEATTRLISGNAENADASPCSSGEDRKKKLDLEPIVERKPSKPPGLSNLAEGMTEANVMSVQARVTRLTSVSNGERGARVVAGWPSWLVAVAGEAINGWIPRKADSFEKLEKIGQGTYSSVYKARDLESDKIVALKKVRFASMDLESVRFMAREIVILRRLDHPNVMKLEGIITSRVSGSLYLVFEYMDHDLAGLAAAPEIKFSEAQIKCYLKQLFHGLEHCHSRGILHRDIKGSNLLIDHNNNLKIGDFGLANFCRPIQKQPLTSRVVTLWYRPPELLLGSTDYGVSVDLWSSGCILAELFTGKPIMPGRTEVEQLHKIFKLCGSPSEEYWKSSRLRHATIFKPQQPYKRSVAETFKDITSSALALLEALLSVEPDRRGTASSALQSEFFTTKPFPSDPLSLPKYPPRKEFDTKLREEEARRRKGGGKGRDETKRGYGDSKAVPAPDANAELQASILKRKMLSNTKSVSEKFTAEEESGAGFPIEPSNGTTQDLYSHSALSMSSTTAFESSANMKANGDDALAGPSQKRPSPRKDLRTHRSYGRNGATQLSRFSNSVAVRDRSEFGSLRDTNSNWHEERIKGKYDDLDGGQSSENYDWSHSLLDKPNHLPKDEQPSGKEPLAYGTKMGRMHYSGPLLPAGVNIEEMLKEHERQIRLAVRRARDKANSHKASNADHNGLTESLLGEEDGIGRL